MLSVDETAPVMEPESELAPILFLKREQAHLAYVQLRTGAGATRSAVVRFVGIRSIHYGWPASQDLDCHPLHPCGLRPYGFHVAPAGSRGVRSWVVTMRWGTLTVFADRLEVACSEFPNDPMRAIRKSCSIGMWTTVARCGVITRLVPADDPDHISSVGFRDLRPLGWLLIVAAYGLSLTVGILAFLWLRAALSPEIVRSWWVAVILLLAVPCILLGVALIYLGSQLLRRMGIEAWRAADERLP